MLYETVKKLCKEKGIPIYELEKRAGVGNGTIRFWKNGSPRLDTLERVADALGIKVTTLINKSKEE